MAEWHLNKLRAALERRGWHIVAELPGNDYDISAIWEIQRSAKRPSLFIEFDGLDDMETLPIDQSYGCRTQGNKSLSLYFGKRGDNGSRKREVWQKKLQHFIEGLDEISI